MTANLKLLQCFEVFSHLMTAHQPLNCEKKYRKFDYHFCG